MARSAGPAESRSAVLRICRSGGDARTLRARLVEALDRLVGFDVYAFLLTDPDTSVGASPLANVPFPAELPALIRLKYLTPVNRWTTLGDPAVDSLWRATGGQPERSPLWRELLSRHGVGDVASMVFQDRYGCWGFLDLWRSTGASAFDERELALLSALVEPVTAALRRSQAETFVVRPPARAHPGPVVLLLSADLEVRGQTPDTHDYLRVLVPPPGPAAPVPASAYNVAAQLLATEAGVDTNPPEARVHLSDGAWLTLRAARMGAAADGDRRDIAVTIEECAPARRVDMFSRAFGLSVREGQLVGHLAGGADTREVARLMHLSDHTVQDHLKSIFAKTGAHSRRELLARALGG
ncbi:MAG TPA: helix-turn-helix transcriptional regulator [Micromonosporaceae bacterium]|nr:helix-turn-helix transcriptional regulator [Micromonosporaceae bacterium]